MRFSFTISDFLQPRAIVGSLLFILMLVSFLTLSPVLQGLYILSVFGLLAIYGENITKISEGEKNYYLLIIVVCLLALPINAFRSPTVGLHFIMVLTGIAASLILAKDGRTYTTSSFVVLAFAQVSIIAFLLIRGTEGFPLEEMVEDISSNGISSFLVCLQINYSIASLRSRGSTTLITAAVTLYVCIIGYGRGSIIASSGIMVVSLLFTFQSLRRDLAIAATIALTAAVGFFLIRNFEQIYYFLDENTKIGSGLFDDARAAMNAEYISRLTGISLLFGVSYDGTLIDRFYNGNPHNSFIRAHHLFGVGYVTAVTLMAGRPLISRLPLPEKAFYSAMFAILLFRASTEPVLFPTTFDTLYFSLFLLLGADRRAVPAPAPRPEFVNA